MYKVHYGRDFGCTRYMVPQCHTVTVTIRMPLMLMRTNFGLKCSLG